jgi:hypothetical protein
MLKVVLRTNQQLLLTLRKQIYHKSQGGVGFFLKPGDHQLGVGF